MTKGIVYYTDNELNVHIARACHRQLQRAVLANVRCSVVSLKPVGFIHPEQNIVLPLTRSYLTMFKQILAGLEALDTDVAFLCEHDVLYAPEHFQFTPPRDDVYYYNVNTWKVNAETGHAVTYVTKQTSGLCANRELLIKHYRKRIARVEQDGFSRRIGFEPGTHNRPERIDDVTSDVWCSAVPNIDIRHRHNLTQSRWRREDFRDQRNCRGWQESDSVPGWGRTEGRFREFLAESAQREAVA